MDVVCAAELLGAALIAGGAGLGAGAVQAELAVALVVGGAGGAGCTSAGQGDADGFEAVVGGIGDDGAMCAGGALGLRCAGGSGFGDADFCGVGAAGECEGGGFTLVLDG